MTRSLLYSLLFSLMIFTSCSTPTKTEGNNDLRINFWVYSLGMTHNSHLGKNFSTESNSFSVTGTFTIYLSDKTEYENIVGLRIADNDMRGWEFDQNDIAAAYNPESNSITIEQLDLHRLDFVSDKLLNVQILDDSSEVVFNRSASLSNELPLPALSTVSLDSDTRLDIRVNFYDSPYDEGNIPFPVRVFPTYVSSNAFSVVWLDDSRDEVEEVYLDLGNLNPISDTNPDDIYSYLYELDAIPQGATQFYLKFRRGGQETGRVLYTRILEIP